MSEDHTKDENSIQEKYELVDTENENLVERILKYLD